MLSNSKPSSITILQDLFEFGARNPKFLQHKTLEKPEMIL